MAVRHGHSSGSPQPPGTTPSGSPTPTAGHPGRCPSRGETRNGRTPDLPKLRDALGRLGQLPCPDLPLKHAAQRWSTFSDSPGLFAGTALLHTELSPGNVHHLVDWAWPTRGASWIDPACAVVWLIAFGHTPTDAETWAGQLPAWHTATPTHLAAFAQAQHTMWASIAEDHPDAWILRAAQGARRWAEHRR
ncbi:MAG: aminoglycoside phosphotransferase [Pseudonocardiaceae bacterium]